MTDRIKALTASRSRRRLTTLRLRGTRRRRDGCCGQGYGEPHASYADSGALAGKFSIQKSSRDDRGRPEHSRVYAALFTFTR